jgi:hypothetical protein
LLEFGEPVVMGREGAALEALIAAAGARNEVPETVPEPVVPFDPAGPR